MKVNPSSGSEFRITPDAASIITAVALLGIGAVAYLAMEVATHSMFYAWQHTLGFAAFFALPALLLLWKTPRRYVLVLLLTFILVIVAIRSIEWNSRKPFLRDLGRIQTQMTVTQVDALMRGLYSDARLRHFVVWDRRIPAYERGLGGRADVALVTYKQGRVTLVEFLPD